MGETDQILAVVKTAVGNARSSFRAGKVKTYEQRVCILKRLREFVVKEEQSICAAIYEDLKRDPQEVNTMSRAVALSEIDTALANLASWMKPKRGARPLLLITDSVKVHSQPYGVVAVLSPWNYPFLLLLRPLINVISAGNTAVLKPSELAPATERLFVERLPVYLDSECYPVVTGGIPMSTELLKQHFDHICFTGSSNVGRIVMRAASANLTPVTLELGGKNPAFVDDSIDLRNVAQRIVHMKSAGAGQICVNTDYIMCLRSVEEKLVEEIGKAIKKLFSEGMELSPLYSRIIHDRHFSYLKDLLDRTRGTKAIDSGTSAETRYMGLMVVTNVQPDDALMENEIFGPILPIMAIDSVDDGIAYLREREKPLAINVFSTNQSNIDKIIDGTSSGQVVVNDVAVQVGLSRTPFGGVGNSGMGAYIGEAGFNNFSHQRTVVHRSPRMEFLNEWLRYGRQPRSTQDLMGMLLATYPVDYQPYFILAVLCVGITVFLSL